ncbi:MAG TPA: autotransporter-associated beta strand repeat-containing protein [Humisphaera sp.]
MSFGIAGMALSGGATTVTVLNTQSIATIVFGAGQTNAVTVTGGTLTFAAAGTVAVNNATDTIASGIGGAGTSFTKSGPGTLVLTADNLYTGTTIVSGGGTLQVGNGTGGTLNGAAGTALTFNAGGGTFNVQEAPGVSQGMGALTFSAGDATVTSTWNNGAGSGNTAVTFASLAARTTGATANFTLGGAGSTAANNKIALTTSTNAPLTTTTNNAGIFFGGASYARYSAANGTFQAVAYGADANAVAPVSGQAATIGATAGADYQYVGGAAPASTVNAASSNSTTLVLGSGNGSLFVAGQAVSGTGIPANTWVTAVSGDTLTLSQAATVAANTTVTPYTSVSAQTALVTNTLNLSGAGASLTIGPGETIQASGILRSGGTAGVAGVISGGTGLKVAGGSGELVVRTDAANDVLEINAPVLANTGTNPLTKTGAGTLVLSGANTYTGTTTVNAGTLAVSGGSAIVNAGAVVVANASGATFQLNANETIGNLSGGGFSGGNVNVQGNTLTLGDSGSQTFGGRFVGTAGGAVVKQGSGTLTLGNRNAFAGSITVNAGALTFAYGNDGSGSALALSTGGAINMAGGTTVNFSPAGSIAVGQVVGGQLTNAPNGWTIGNAINVTAGTASLKFNGNDNRWTFGGTVTGGTAGNAVLAISNTAADRQGVTFAGAMTDGAGGTLGLTVSMAPVTAANPYFVNLSGPNTFTGPITVTTTGTAAGNSYLTVGGESGTTGIGSTRSYAVAGSGYLGGGSYANTISLGTNTVFNYLSSATQTLGGVISGGGALLKEGSGTLTLTAVNTYSGPTTVTAGVLRVNNAFSAATDSGTGTGPVSITATLGGTGQIAPGSPNGVTVNNGGVLAPGSGGVGTLTVNSGNTTAASVLTFAAGAKLLVELDAVGQRSDRVSVTSAATGDVAFNNTVVNFTDLTNGNLPPGSYTLFTADADNAYANLTLSGTTITAGLTIGTGLGAYPGSTLDVSGRDIVLNVVPEPGAVGLVAVAGAGLLSRRTRKRRLA